MPDNIFTRLVPAPLQDYSTRVLVHRLILILHIGLREAVIVSSCYEETQAQPKYG